MSDLRLVLTSRLVRAFGFGFAAVLLGVHLERRGLSPGAIGLALTLGLVSASLLSLVLAQLASRLGRRRALAASGILMLLAGLDLTFAGQSWLLLAAGVTGMLGGASVDVGPFLAIEQAMVSEAVDGPGRNRAFARYSLTGGLASAAGGLAAGLAGSADAVTAFFGLYAAIGAITAVIPLLISERVEVDAPSPVFASLRPLAGLSALFAIDSFGGGLVAQAVIAYWLHVRFGTGPRALGPAFAAMGLVQALSYEAAGWLSDRIGLVRTMVFTHLPSNVILLLIPFCPSLGWAIALLIVRTAISQMDVPARQAYVASIVAPGERAGALALTGAVRGGAQAVGPVLTGIAIAAASFGTPFFVAGGLKIAYDLGLYAGFSSRKGDHER